MPMAGIRTKPVRSVPTIAPAVLTAYNRLTLDPIDLLAGATAALSSGRVIPIIAVGTTRIANEHSNLATVSTLNDSGAPRCSAK